MYVRIRSDARLYALIDHDGDHRVDEVRAVAGARAPDVPAIVLDDVPHRAQHGWRYVRYGQRQWLYLPFELERSSRPLVQRIHRSDESFRRPG